VPRLEEELLDCLALRLRGRRVRLRFSFALRAQQIHDRPVHPRQRGFELRPALDQPPLQEGRPLDDFLRPALLADPWQLHDDPIAADLLDQRLGDTELVDPGADDLQRPVGRVHLRFRSQRALGVRHLEREVHAALEVEPELDRRAGPWLVRGLAPALTVIVEERPAASDQDQDDDEESAFERAEHRASFSASSERDGHRTPATCESIESWRNGPWLSTDAPARPRQRRRGSSPTIETSDNVTRTLWTGSNLSPEIGSNGERKATWSATSSRSPRGVSWISRTGPRSRPTPTPPAHWRSLSPG